jgi:hypothetical protein
MSESSKFEMHDSTGAVPPDDEASATQAHLRNNHVENPGTNMKVPMVLQGPTHKKLRYTNKNAKSSVWNYFEVYHDNEQQHLAHCIICQQDVNYTKAKSTGMLTRHLRRKHRTEFDMMVDEEATRRLQQSSSSLSPGFTLVPESGKVQGTITSFVKFTPSFEKKLLEWVVDTYQPLQVCEHPSFREMCQSLNSKAPTIGVSKLQNMLSMEAGLMRAKVKSILKERTVSITTDAWTSCNNKTYITCTAHWIHPKTWSIHHFPLGIFQNIGTSQAEDVVRYVTKILFSYDITYHNLFCIVTDTEATMIKAACIFSSEAEEALTSVSWHGCIDHLLNLVTKLAFKDNEESHGAMNKARELVGHFSSSSQAEEILLSKQVSGTPVKCIQDVTTRWWSTYSMCERLLHLRPYFYLMEADGSLDKNLTEVQWMIIKDTTVLLQPFMFAQRLLEGETYVTVSMIAYIIWKVRKGLVAAIESPNSSLHVMELATQICFWTCLSWQLPSRLSS